MRTVVEKVLNVVERPAACSWALHRFGWHYGTARWPDGEFFR